MPVADASFDIVFCDHGAMSFCDPAQSVPEVARLLRPGGLLAFCATAPLLYFTYDADARPPDPAPPPPRVRPPALAVRRRHSDYCVPTGEWLRLFPANGLVAEDLVELRAPKGATTTFTDFAPYRWARRWPAEQIWKVRKVPYLRSKVTPGGLAVPGRRRSHPRARSSYFSTRPTGLRGRSSRNSM